MVIRVRNWVFDVSIPFFAIYNFRVCPIKKCVRIKIKERKNYYKCYCCKYFHKMHSKAAKIEKVNVTLLLWESCTSSCTIYLELKPKFKKLLGLMNSNFSSIFTYSTDMWYKYWPHIFTRKVILICFINYNKLIK